MPKSRLRKNRKPRRDPSCKIIDGSYSRKNIEKKVKERFITMTLQFFKKDVEELEKILKRKTIFIGDKETKLTNNDIVSLTNVIKQKKNKTEEDVIMEE